MLITNWEVLICDAKYIFYTVYYISRKLYLVYQSVTKERLPWTPYC